MATSAMEMVPLAAMGPIAKGRRILMISTEGRGKNGYVKVVVAPFSISIRMS